MLIKHKGVKRWTGDKPISFNSMFGPFISSLRSVNQKIEGETEDLTTLYRKLDYGLVLGHEVEYYFSNRFSVAPGLRLTWGWPNIFKGNNEIPASFRSTRNAAIEFTLSVYYQTGK